MKLVLTEEDKMQKIFIGEDKEKILEVSDDWIITQIEGEKLSGNATKFIVTIEKKEEESEITKLFRDLANGTPLPFF